MVELKEEFIQAGINAGFMCVVMVLKHLISIKLCKSKCFGHRLFEMEVETDKSPIENV